MNLLIILVLKRRQGQLPATMNLIASILAQEVTQK